MTTSDEPPDNGRFQANFGKISVEFGKRLSTKATSTTARLPEEGGFRGADG